MKKIAHTKLTNASLTTVPKSVKLFLKLTENEFIGWYIDDKQNIVIKREKNEK